MLAHAVFEKIAVFTPFGRQNGKVGLRPFHLFVPEKSLGKKIRRRII
jgi:hypothetical protein